MSEAGNDAAWPLTGHDAAVEAFRAAYDTGRLHHAWLLEGPSGIGKAQLAKQIASFILGATCAAGTLTTTRNDPVAQKLLAESHPDIRWLDRRPDEAGKIKQDIPVDAIRELNSFFALKPALGGWRVGVIDSIDELNRSGMNALLKTLEEPPSQCLLLLISHGTRPVLPTVRSRCRRLRLHVLSQTDADAVLARLQTAQKLSNAADVSTLSAGRPGHALSLASANGLAAANAARTFLNSLPKPTDAALGDALMKIGADEVAFDVFSARALEWLQMRADETPAIAEHYLGVTKLVATARELNMDRTQAGAELIGRLQKIPVTG